MVNKVQEEQGNLLKTKVFFKSIEKGLVAAGQKISSISKCQKYKVISLVLLSLVIGPAAVDAKQVTGELSKEGPVTHLEFSGLKTWDYELNKSKNSIKIILPAVDQKTKVGFAGWAGELIKSIKVKDKVADKKIELTISLKDSTIDSFDYLTDNPSRLIIDFYQDPKKLEKIRANKLAKSSKKKKIKNKKIYKTVLGKYVRLNKLKRKPASAEFIKIGTGAPKDNSRFETGVYDGSDSNYNRFRISDYDIKEESIIASKDNIYIRFPVLKMKTNFLNEILENPPEYKIKENKIVGNKKARLLVIMFNENRHEVFLKTYEIYKKEVKKDDYYDEILRYMNADVHLKLWQRDKHNYHYNKALTLYRKLLNNYPKSILSDRTELLVNYLVQFKGQGIENIRLFQNYITKYPESKEIDRAKMAMAEGLLNLNKFDEARKVYAQIENNPISKDTKVEAFYRKGDSYLLNRNYEDAISSYKASLKKYPEYDTKFPNAYFNMAESFFWSGKYKQSLANYVNYVKSFPNDDHNPYALTRIGEILEILGADEKQVVGAFIEGFFRFENHPGAKVARVRLLSKQMSTMSKKELEKTEKELKGIGKELRLPRIKEFIVLMKSEGYRARRDYDKAIEQLITYYQNNPTRVSLKLFKNLIVKNISDSINENLKNKDYFKALNIYGRYANTWMKGTDRIDLEYFKGQAFELSGVYSESEEIYKSVIGRLKKIKGTRESVERKVKEHLPNIDETYLRVAAAQVKLRKYSKAYKNLRNINESHLSKAEQIERTDLSGKIYIEKGQTKLAIKSLKKLIKEWDGDTYKLNSSYLSLAKMQIRGNDLIGAEKNINLVSDSLSLKEEKSKEEKALYTEALKTKGDILLAQGKQIAAIEIYLDLLENYDSAKKLSPLRFKVGSILYERRDLKGAEKVWGDLDSKKDKYYKKIAEEKLASAVWEDDYKKYINRIPAMKK